MSANKKLCFRLYKVGLLVFVASPRLKNPSLKQPTRVQLVRITVYKISAKIYMGKV